MAEFAHSNKDLVLCDSTIELLTEQRIIFKGRKLFNLVYEFYPSSFSEFDIANDFEMTNKHKKSLHEKNQNIRSSRIVEIVGYFDGIINDTMLFFLLMNNIDLTPKAHFSLNYLKQKLRESIKQQ